jgi:DNA-directed RNA polymerase subunit RPC12/RpoP
MTPSTCWHCGSGYVMSQDTSEEVAYFCASCGADVYRVTKPKVEFPHREEIEDDERLD